MSNSSDDVTPSGSSNEVPDNTHAVNHRFFNIKAPPFCPDRPALWFAQLEAQFFSHNVTSEHDKFSLCVAQISTQHAAEVEDLIVTPPETTPYTIVKTALITRFSKSKEAKLQQLLDGESIGDRSPSSFLRHLKSLAPSVDTDVLRAKWSSVLPEQTRAILTTQVDTSLEQQAVLADKLHVIFPVKHTNAIQTSAAASLEQQVAELTHQVSALTKAFGSINKQRGRSRTREVNRNVDSSKTRPFFDKSTGFCFYHHRYGEKAQKCMPNCKYVGNSNEDH